jgi:hypothetical protein
MGDPVAEKFECSVGVWIGAVAPVYAGQIARTSIAAQKHEAARKRHAHRRHDVERIDGERKRFHRSRRELASPA